MALGMDKGCILTFRILKRLFFKAIGIVAENQAYSETILARVYYMRVLYSTGRDMDLEAFRARQLPRDASSITSDNSRMIRSMVLVTLKLSLSLTLGCLNKDSTTVLAV
jgi:hypothetical protein